MELSSRHPLLTAIVMVVAIVTMAAAVGADPVPAVKEVEPEIFYLRDDGGRLVPVPGFRYRDFVDLLRLKDGLPGLPQPPAAVLERIEVGGDLAAHERNACELMLTLRLRQIRAGWARVPLALDGFVLTASPNHEGEGRFILDADAKAGGYVAWLEAGAESQHVVTLVGDVAVGRSPAADSLRLDLPRATASVVRLRTPRHSPRVDVRPAGPAPRISPAEGGDSGTVVECSGVSGVFEIVVADRRDGDRPGDAPPHAVVESLVRIDGTIASTTATVRLEGLPADTREVQIALPPRTRLETVTAPAALVGVTGDAEHPQALIRIQPDAGGRAVVELACERPVDATGSAAFEPMGFAVAGVPAWRQHGRVSLVVEGDWQVDWEDQGGSRRVDPPVAARRPGFVAAFAYDAQPARLPLRVRPRGSRVVVEPAYRYDISAARIGLVATLRVIVRGAPVSRVALGLEGWSVDDVGPPGIVDAAAVVSSGGSIVIPFVQPLSGEATVDVRCSMPIDRSTTTVGWKLPVPRADLVGPAQVTIASDSDIEVLPEPSAISGLVRQVASPPRRGEAPRIAYRLDGTEGAFSARRRFLPRRADAVVVAQAAVAAPRTRVEETIRFEVANVPLEFVDLNVARSILEDGSLEIRQEGELLNPFEVSTAAEAPDGLATIRVMLATPLLGAGDLGVAFSLPTPDVPAETTVAENLPLPLPVEARIVRQSFTLAAGDQFTVDVRGDAWTRDVAAQAAGPARVWIATGAQTAVPLALAMRPESGAGDTVIEAAWYETRLLPDRRDDVRTFAISSTAPAIRLWHAEPSGAGSAESRTPPRVRVDGALVAVVQDSDGAVQVPLPTASADSSRRRCVLEIESTGPRGRSDRFVALPERVVLEAPRFPAGTVLRRFCWELHVAADEHVVVPPSGWTSQQRWRWSDFGPEYAPLVSRAALADWIAAAAQRRPATADVPVAERRVVYAGVGDPGTAAVWMAPTWLLVLVVSGVALATGLAMVYRAALRRVPVVLSIGAVAALVAAVVPDLAPLVGLAAVPGVVLSLVAAALRSFIDRPAVRPPQWGPPVAAESSTRYMPAASIVISPSAVHSPTTVTKLGGSGA
ncbi:MAG: hypothetical protein WCR51_04965 [Planctomycetia bacterium]